MLIRTSGEIWNEEEEETYHDQVFGCIVKQRLRGGNVDLLHQREAEEPLTKQLCLGSSTISWARNCSSAVEPKPGLGHHLVPPSATPLPMRDFQRSRYNGGILVGVVVAVGGSHVGNCLIDQHHHLLGGTLGLTGGACLCDEDSLRQGRPEALSLPHEHLLHPLEVYSCKK
ncbi:hypothetical protein BHE74_00030928 [Ensete ventricosum]|nr:hypothetical protein BHE74_00030928 [Ensete ventricosum]